VTTGVPPTDRQRELAANLAAVRARIESACSDAGRSPSELALIAVTKTFPVSDIDLLAELGVEDVGENRDQEASAKVAQLSLGWAEPAQRRLRWHFIGALQTNKCRSVARYAHLVHSVDRPRLVEALAAAAAERSQPLGCLVQVDLDLEHKPGRSGAAVEDVSAIADAIAASSGLELRGVMAVAPLGDDPWRAFARLAEVAARLRGDHPTAALVSAGMSGDLEAAIANGATHLRVGAALLGSRPHAR
jgi:pyridoxal phosphate enzyme (YggS family)